MNYIVDDYFFNKQTYYVIYNNAINYFIYAQFKFYYI